MRLHKILKKTRAKIILLVTLLSLVLIYTASGPPHVVELEPIPVLFSDTIAFEQQVKPILERRCVVCHGCYDAPCQLQLSSIEGLRRGASAERIYEPKRITTMQPTRLFVDADTTEQWRVRGFSAMLNEAQQTPENNLKNSVLYHLLHLKQQHPQPRQVLLPESFTLGLNRQESCPTLQSIDEFAQKNPLWGMPYAMPNLEVSEYQTLVSWLAQGASALPPSQPSATMLPQIEQWEHFLNQSSECKCASNS